MSTETDRANPLLIRANKLQLVERLADDLAHEIKNPLHSMVINLEVLRRRIDRAGIDQDADLMRYIGVLSGELERVNQRIDLLLRLARPDRWAETATLNEVLSEMRDLLQLEARHHDVEIHFDLESHPFRTAMPREPLRQVILNLVLAALDLLPRGALLRLRTGQIERQSFLSVERRNEDGDILPLDGDDPAELARVIAVAQSIAEEIRSSVEVGANGSLVFTHTDPA